MFSGIVEAKCKVLAASRVGGVIRVEVERPTDFDDLKPGDSVAFNGVCLTVELADARKIEFALGAETLSVTGWNEGGLPGVEVNLERSLRAGDRVHGHFVTGHVDGMGEVVEAMDAGGSMLVSIKGPAGLREFVWRKGSWALNGVSLTINDVIDREDGSVIIKHCLIPETLRHTNLLALKAGDRVSVEVDASARAFSRARELQAR